MGERWHLGVWLGKLWRSDEHILAYDNEIWRAATIRALPEEESWSKEDIQNIRATPWDQNPQNPAPPEVIPHCPITPQEVQESAIPVARAVRIELRDLEAFGYTRGCPKCERIRDGRNKGYTGGHAETCRARVVEEMRKRGDARQRKRVADAESKVSEQRAADTAEDAGEERDEDQRQAASSSCGGCDAKSSTSLPPPLAVPPSAQRSQTMRATAPPHGASLSHQQRTGRRGERRRSGRVPLHVERGGGGGHWTTAASAACAAPQLLELQLRAEPRPRPQRRRAQ